MYLIKYCIYYVYLNLWFFFFFSLPFSLSSDVAQGSSSDTNCLTMSLVECSSYCLERKRRGGEEEEGESAGDVTPFITHLINIVS